jgi:DNA topoisomerase-2
LCGTIVGMAQNFVGSNNLPILEPLGQFGTRLQGGKDAASARYIFTKLSPLTRAVYHPADDALLKYLNEDGQNIEPEWYMPIIPMVLINGSDGIGTGWSTSIPNYNPRDVIENLHCLMKGADAVPMHPWYRGFKGMLHYSYARDDRVYAEGRLQAYRDNQKDRCAYRRDHRAPTSLMDAILQRTA